MLELDYDAEHGPPEERHEAGWAVFLSLSCTSGTEGLRGTFLQLFIELVHTCSCSHANALCTVENVAMRLGLPGAALFLNVPSCF